MLQKWIKQPHVVEWWQEPEDEVAFQEKYLHKLQQRRVKPYITCLDGKPIGYIQSYEAAGLGDGWWPDAAAGTYGVDQYIGDPEAIGKGVGSAVLKIFVEKLFEDRLVQTIITDPEPDNGRAIRSYEKAGFQKIGVTNTPDGEAMLMRLDRYPEFPLSRE